MTTEDDLKLIEKLNSNPSLKKRVEEILNIAHNSSEELITADQAEEKTIEEVQKLGREVLREWAVNQHEKVAKRIKEKSLKQRNI